jgi:hypothetical protein
MSENKELLASAEHWERLADESESAAKWDREVGIDLSQPGRSPGDNRARQYRSTARCMRLEAETGVAHCACHEKPATQCPLGNMVRK